MTDAQRISWMVGPGVSLFPASSLSTAMGRANLAGQESGLGQEYWAFSPLLQIPVPVPDVAGARWPGVAPDYLRLPIFWLPKEVAAPVIYHREDGSTFDEPTKAWMLRIGMELTLSGLYDEESGSWLDVLSTFGIDPSEEGFEQRYSSWVAGNPDPQLDAVSLDEYLVEDRDLVFDIVDAIYDDAGQVGAVVTASSLRADLAKLMANDEPIEIIKQVFSVTADLVSENLSNYLPPNRNSEDFIWLLQQVSVGASRLTTAEQAKAIVAELDVWLGEVEEAYSPAFGRLGDFFSELVGQDA